jgi:hypothetical protein
MYKAYTGNATNRRLVSSVHSQYKTVYEVYTDDATNRRLSIYNKLSMSSTQITPPRIV